jgi:hypothetical protein
MGDVETDRQAEGPINGSLREKLGHSLPHDHGDEILFGSVIRRGAGRLDALGKKSSPAVVSPPVVEFLGRAPAECIVLDAELTDESGVIACLPQ